MDDFWALAVVLAVVLVALVALTVRSMDYLATHTNVGHPSVMYSELEPHLKSGDLIFYIAHTHGFSNSVFTGDLYSHAGVVARGGGGLFVSEALPSAPPGDPAGGAFFAGANLFPLRERVRGYPGAVFVARLARPLAAREQNKLWAMAVAARTPYPSAWQLACSLVRPDTRRARHCMQHIAWILDGVGLTDRLLESGVFAVSKKVSGLGSLRGGNSYKAKHEVLYDLAAVPPADMA